MQVVKMLPSCLYVVVMSVLTYFQALHGVKF